MFASKSITEHIARGLIGFGAFIAALFLATSHPWVSLAAIPVGLLALRGCPMCWTLGLVQTVAAKLQGKSADEACVDGSCRLRP